MTVLVLLMLAGLVYLIVRQSDLTRRLDKLEKQLARPASPPVAPRPHKSPPTVASGEAAPAPPPEKPVEPAIVPVPPREQRVAREAAKAETSDSLRLDLELTEPTAYEKALTWVKHYFTHGNVIVRVGVIVLFFGIAFLLRYASQQGVLPVEWRLAGVALLGVALLAVGWRLRHTRPGYALILQGGGVGVLYMTVFAALRLFSLLPAEASFVLMLLMVVLCAALALLQNARSLAVMAVTGGFLAPVLASTGAGSHIVLFSYYLLLNAGILIMAWFKAWRSLNLLGFVFTFVIATAWGVLRYTPENLPSAQIFLILFFLLYVLIAILFATRQPPQLKGYVDGTLVFGVPLVASALQAGLVYQYEYGLAWSALAAGLFYGALTIGCKRLAPPSMELLKEAFLGLAVVFLTLVIPFALDNRFVASAWALEGAAILWISLRQQHMLGAAFALCLQLLAGLMFLPEFADRTGDGFIVNAVYLGGVLLALAGGFSSFLLRQQQEWGQQLRGWVQPMLVWGLGWWFVTGIAEILAGVDTYYELALLLFMGASGVLFCTLEHRLRWPELRFVTFLQWVAMILLAMLAVVGFDYPLEHYSWLGWSLFLVAYHGVLYWRERRDLPQTPLLALLHVSAWWTLTVLVCVQLYEVVARHLALTDDWRTVMLVLPLLGFIALAQKLPVWPWRPYRSDYLLYASAPMVGAALLWFVFVATPAAANFPPLPYLPLLNGLDITQLLVLWTAWYGTRQLVRVADIPDINGLLWMLGGLLFLWLNAILLRSLHHWAGVDYTLANIMTSTLAQAVLSVFWTLLGLAVVFVASRRRWRDVWLVGAGLLGVVVVKLFALDMRGSDTLEVIVAFIAVGLLLLVVGYLSPLPPKKQE